MKPTSVSLWKLCESQANLLCPDRRVTIGTEWGALRLYITNCDGLQDPPGSTETDLTSPPGPLVGDIPQSASTSFGIKQAPQCRTSNMDSLLLLTERHFDSRSALSSETRNFYPPRLTSITDCGDKYPTRSEDPGIQSLFCSDSSNPGTLSHGCSVIESREPPGSTRIALSDETEVMNTVNFDSGGIDRNVRNDRGNLLSSSEPSTVAIKPEVPPKVTLHQYSSTSTGIHIHQLF